MSIDNELSQANNFVGQYLAPSIKVVEVKAMRVMCQSPVTTGISNMDNEEGEW